MARSIPLMAVCLLVILSVPAYAADGYKELKFGMTRDKVIEIVKNSCEGWTYLPECSKWANFGGVDFAIEPLFTENDKGVELLTQIRFWILVSGVKKLTQDVESELNKKYKPFYTASAKERVPLLAATKAGYIASYGDGDISIYINSVLGAATVEVHYNDKKMAAENKKKLLAAAK